MVLGLAAVAAAVKVTLALPPSAWTYAVDLIWLAPLGLALWRLAAARGEPLSRFSDELTRRAVWDIALLFAAGSAAYGMTHGLLERFAPGLADTAWVAGPASLRGSSALPALLLATVCAAAEESLLRGVLQTRLSQLGLPAVAVIALSVMAQTALRVEAGWLPALAFAAQFTLFAIYFQRTHQLMPLVIARAMQVALGLVSLAR